MVPTFARLIDVQRIEKAQNTRGRPGLRLIAEERRGERSNLEGVDPGRVAQELPQRHAFGLRHVRERLTQGRIQFQYAFLDKLGRHDRHEHLCEFADPEDAVTIHWAVVAPIGQTTTTTPHIKTRRGDRQTRASKTVPASLRLQCGPQRIGLFRD
jgi:hypothetical protein